MRIVNARAGVPTLNAPPGSVARPPHPLSLAEPRRNLDHLRCRDAFVELRSIEMQS